MENDAATPICRVTIVRLDEAATGELRQVELTVGFTVEEVLTRLRLNLDKVAIKGPHPMTRLRQLREAAGLNQGQMAERAGLPRPHYNRIELGHSTPQPETLQKIAAALGVSPTDLIDDENNEKAD